METFLTTVALYQKEIDGEMAKFFKVQLKGSKNPFLTDTLKTLREFSLRPAKRIRAILVVYGYMLAGGNNRKEILKTSIFIELLHNFLLVHDDIIDNGLMRRGGKTLHLQYKAKKNAEHYGISMALAAGDLLDILGRKAITRSSFPKDTIIKSLAKLDEILAHTIYGEMFEVYLRNNLIDGKKVHEKDILDVYRSKTAFYTFVGPLQIGGLLANAKPKLLESFEKIGLDLGVAFQMKDDLQDIFEDSVPAELASDIKESQPNFLILKTLQSKRGSVIKKYLGKKKIGGSDIKIIREAMIQSGAYQECMAMATKLIRKAKKHILAVRLIKGKQFLLDLADYILERKN